jgi:hypothetical protein
MSNSIEELIRNKTLKIIPVNKNKVIESEYANKFYDTNNEKINIANINYIENKNLNDQILIKYKKKPDIIIINFSEEKNILNINSIPIYPIIYNNIIYITPIIIEQLNGFSNIFLDKESCINDFYNRIYSIIGALISDDKFNINISNYDKSGIKDKKIGFLKDNTVSHIEKWMTRFIPGFNFGWFSIFNRLAIDYVFENYKIDSIAELGTYFGKSTMYISNKNKNMDYYCFDRFENLFLTDYITKKLQFIDLNFFYKYIRFETFHSNLKNHPNLFSIKNNNYLAVDFLKKNNINIDLFYIDFCKDDTLLIDFINKIFDNYPNAIIVGDDLVHLTFSMNYLSKKYNLVKLNACYICTYKTEFINKKKLIDEYNNINNKLNDNNFNNILNYEIKYKTNFLKKEIEKKVHTDKIINYLKIININPNYLVDLDNNNIFHDIIKLYKETSDNYYINLYNKICTIYKDESCKNDSNLVPLDYKLFENKYFKI